jgi:ligand-binding SRPBCC domain-containing protein
MPVIRLETWIQAPAERCFLLSLSVDMHTFSTAHTHERVIGGVTSGIMKKGDFVTWRARHFGIWQELSSKITEYNYPTYFCDEMISGAFKSFRHEHHFLQQAESTLMQDIFDFESPLGIAGKLANGLFLTTYMKNLLIQRNRTIKAVAEGNEWKRFLSGKEFI